MTGHYVLLKNLVTQIHKDHYINIRENKCCPVNLDKLLRVHDLSGSVARHLSGRHSAPKGVPNETNGSATGEPKDEIRRNV